MNLIPKVVLLFLCIVFGARCATESKMPPSRDSLIRVLVMVDFLDWLDENTKNKTYYGAISGDLTDAEWRLVALKKPNYFIRIEPVRSNIKIEKRSYVDNLTNKPALVTQISIEPNNKKEALSISLMYSSSDKSKVVIFYELSYDGRDWHISTRKMSDVLG
jgi:hypothetical protein